MSSGASEILIASERNAHIPPAHLFQKKELVGKGAYGGVFKAIHTPTGLVVALKVIDLDTPDDDISEIQKEVALLSEMRDAARHNITLYHGSYLNGTELWIAMDFASGGSIRTLMKSGPIAEKYIVLIVREVLVALSFLHRQGIIHRDVKAANVLLTQNGRILLCDFGVAAHLQTNNKRSTFIGTPLWMAPEVITDGKLYDTKADIWSLGVTTYEIATGNPPYFGMEPLRACALIPRTAPAKLEAGPWSLIMREFLAMCLQVDPANRPVADELSKTKWIKSTSKLPMSLLLELIGRYRAWIQTGGQRASLAGMDSLVREDTFDAVEELWDFEGNTDDEEPVEPLGDEPPRSLDDQAAISNLRPPKPAHAPAISRNHPLLRLFDAESNPYASATPPSFINLPSGAASMDTVRPMISIPSFEEMDEMAEAKTAKFVELPTDLISPSTVRVNPFSWTTQQPSAPGPPSPYLPPSPRMRAPTPDSVWGSGSGFETPIDSSFPDTLHSFHPVTSSPSLPSIATGPDRPFAGARRRADTAPSFEYPPLGPEIPSPLPTPTHSNNTSISSSSSNGNSSLMMSSSSSTSSHTTFSAASSNAPRPFARSRSALETQPSDANRPFRERKGSDAGRPVPVRMATMDSGPRPRTASDSRPSGLRPKEGLKPLQISTPQSAFGHRTTGSGTFSYATPPASAPAPLDRSASPTFSLTAAAPSPVDAFPFPTPTPTPTRGTDKQWPTGPELRPLDYAKLVTPADVHGELERAIKELGVWLEVVDGGLGRILSGTA